MHSWRQRIYKKSNGDSSRLNYFIWRIDLWHRLMLWLLSLIRDHNSYLIMRWQIVLEEWQLANEESYLLLVYWPTNMAKEQREENRGRKTRQQELLLYEGTNSINIKLTPCSGGARGATAPPEIFFSFKSILKIL